MSTVDMINTQTTQGCAEMPPVSSGPRDADISHITRKYDAFISWIVIASICFPILNPPIGKSVFYLYGVMPLLSLSYWKTITSRISLKVAALFVVIMAAAILQMLRSDYTTFLKISFLFIGTTYLLSYFNKAGTLLIHKLMCITVLFGLAQYITFIVNPSLGILLGPANIYEVLYGSDLRGNSNFYATDFTGGLLYRVSGLSGESGFYAALLSACVVILLSDGSIDPRAKKRFIWVYIIGLFLSFSKISASLFIIAAFIPFRSYLTNKMLPIASIFVLLGSVAASAILFGTHFSFDNTLAHRIGGYFYLANYYWDPNLLFGTTPTNTLVDRYYGMLPADIVSNLEDHRELMTGMPQLIVNYGVAYYVLLVLFFYFYGVSAFKFIAYFLITFSVSPLTSDTFCLLAISYALSRDLKG